jgi:hypothetical protein
MFHVKHFPWLKWTVTGYAGIGIWDFMTDWQSTLHGYLRTLFSYLFPAYVLRGPKKETLQRWDQLNRKHKVVGIGELDNHASVKKIMGFPVSVFPFTKAFRFIRTHVMTEEPLARDIKKDIELLLSALCEGKAYMAAEYYHEAKGFSFAIGDKFKSATMGDEFILENDAILTVILPAAANVRIIKDGILFREETTRQLTCSLGGKGVYRVEASIKVWNRYLPWIFSNPIYVK